MSPKVCTPFFGSVRQLTTHHPLATTRPLRRPTDPHFRLSATLPSETTTMVVHQPFNNANIGVVGFILSAYSVYVEHKVELHNDDPGGEEFHALCDIEVRQ